MRFRRLTFNFEGLSSEKHFLCRNKEIPNNIKYSKLGEKFIRSQSQETGSLETRAKLAVLPTYVKNQTILQPILFYRASKCKQTKELSNEGCLWTHSYLFIRLLSVFFLLYVKMQTNQDHTVLKQVVICQRNTN